MDEVTWLGVGRMGEAMADRLIDGGVSVHAWNRTPARLAYLAGRGARKLADPAASTAPVAFSMVLDDHALDQLWQAERGLLAAAKPPRVWVDCSTVSVEASRRAAAAATARGIGFVAAPVSGNPGVVRAGNLIVAASGPDDAVGLARPLLELVARKVYLVGGEHEARVVKLCTNAVLAVLAGALAEALVLAESQGVRRGALMEFINDSAIGSPFTRYKTDAFVRLDLTPAFTPQGQRKDLRLALDMASRAEVPLPLTSATEVTFSRLVASGLGEGRDFAALILLAAQDAARVIAPET